MKFKVGTGTLAFVQGVGCQTCHQTVNINNGLPLECRDYTPMESEILRRRALKDEQLFNSDFVRIVDRSALGADLQIKSQGIEIGDIRTEDSGARAVSECRYNFEGFTVDDFTKSFYVVNTNKHLKICPRKLAGSKLQNMIGDKSTDFDNFADTDLSDILVAAIIEKYTKHFLAKFILLSVWGSASKDSHGDDGVLAKAWYAFKGQYFNTFSYTFTDLSSGNSIEAIQGGKSYSKSVDADFGGDKDAALLDFVNWINKLKNGRERIYNASVDFNTNKVYVVARYATYQIDIRVGMLEDGALADWGGVMCSPQSNVIAECLQNYMPINDTPKMFNYQTVDETNFIPLFKKYTKEFLRYLHRNGFENYTADDILIGIDPEMLLERDDAVGAKVIDGVSLDFMKQIGLAKSRFRPLNALNNTGLFFMTLPQNILVLSDNTNQGNSMASTGQVRVKEVCDGEYGVIFDLPLGSGVEHFGAFASNLCGSYFVEDNNLDSKEPYANTRAMLPCYCTTCTDSKIKDSCTVSASVTTDAVYDEDSNTTDVTVTVTATGLEGTANGSYAYELSYSLSDGTSATGIDDASFIITLPNDVTDSGLVLNITGKVAGVVSDGVGVLPDVYCDATVLHTTTLGEGSAESSNSSDFCKFTFEEENSPQPTDGDIVVTLTDATGTTNYPLVDTALSLGNVADLSAIEDEIEAIVAGSLVTLLEGATGAGNGEKGFNLTVDAVPSLILAITVSYASNTNSYTLDNSCA